MSSPIDLTRLPAPNIIEPLDYEQILAERKASLLTLVPEDRRDEVEATMALESEPLTIQLQESAYRELTLRNRVNDAGRAMMLAFARGADQDQIGGNYNTERLVITEADDTANPPVAEVLEDDDAYQLRIQEAFDGLSVAGPGAAYEFLARSASGKVADARCVSPAPCEIVVYILSTEGDGTADQALLDIVDAALNPEEVRPLGDYVLVRSAEIVHYEIDAVIAVSNGPESEIIKQAADKNVTKESKPKRALARSVFRSKLDAVLHVEGVRHVLIHQPAADIVLTKGQAAYCTAINVVPLIEDDND
jgi:phage-related baseplate assembly protein